MQTDSEETPLFTPTSPLHDPPVLVDDIISTGRTMIATIGHLKRLGLHGTVCIGVHGIFAQHAYEALLSAGALHIATSNSIRHESNDIDLSPLLASAVRDWLCDLTQ